MTALTRTLLSGVLTPMTTYGFLLGCFLWLGCDDGGPSTDGDGDGDGDMDGDGDGDGDGDVDGDGDADADGDGDGDVDGDGDEDADIPIEPCTEYENGLESGEVETNQLTEISGIAVSRTHDDVLYAHNDSGDSARFFAMRYDGAHLAEFSLQFSGAQDWEDMALGPGPSDGDWLYFGDIGDNAERRSDIIVYTVPEPLDPASGGELGGVERLIFEYPDGAHNAETLLVDPRNGDLYILTKTSDGDSGLYVSRAPHDLVGTRTLELVTWVSFGSLGGAPETTAGDIVSSGGAIAIRTYTHVYLWTRSAEQTIGEAMAGDRFTLPSEFEPQGEAIAFAADGLGYFTISEGHNQPVWYFAAAESCAP